jgi:hypothetical protein
MERYLVIHSTVVNIYYYSGSRVKRMMLYSFLDRSCLQVPILIDSKSRHH